jgi:hypothetical protein
VFQVPPARSYELAVWPAFSALGVRRKRNPQTQPRSPSSLRSVVIFWTMAPGWFEHVLSPGRKRWRGQDRGSGELKKKIANWLTLQLTGTHFLLPPSPTFSRVEGSPQEWRALLLCANSKLTYNVCVLVLLALHTPSSQACLETQRWLDSGL